MNSEEAEKLVWAAQTIFATGCELHVLAVSQHTIHNAATHSTTRKPVGSACAEVLYVV